MKKYIMIILVAISTLSLSFSAEAYTREELENQLHNDMSAAYSTYNINKEKLIFKKKPFGKVWLPFFSESD